MPFSQKRNWKLLCPWQRLPFSLRLCWFRALQYSGLTQLLMRKWGHLSWLMFVPNLLDWAHATLLCCLSCRRGGRGRRLELLHQLMDEQTLWAPQPLCKQTRRHLKWHVTPCCVSNVICFMYRNFARLLNPASHFGDTLVKKKSVCHQRASKNRILVFLG